MKKQDITGTIVYLLILGFGAVFVFTVLKNHSGASGLGDLYILFNLGAFLAGIVFNSLYFELAHVLGAIVGGYEIISVCTLSLCIKKDNGKWKFCFSTYNGLTGETKIVPKEGRKNLKEKQESKNILVKGKDNLKQGIKKAGEKIHLVKRRKEKIISRYLF